MEDTSYVSLSLPKYNELYDKAKKYDELYEKYKGDIEVVMDKIIFDCLQEQSLNEEVSATKEEVVETTDVSNEWDVELLQPDHEIPMGAKGKLLQENSKFPFINWDKHYNGTYNQVIGGIGYENVYCVDLCKIKKLNEREEK